MANDEFKSVVLAVIQKSKNAEIRVIEYEINGKKYPMLEKRAVWADEGTEKYGKVKGFNFEEYKMIIMKAPEIYSAFGQASKTTAPIVNPESVKKESF